MSITYKTKIRVYIKVIATIVPSRPHKGAMTRGGIQKAMIVSPPVRVGPLSTHLVTFMLNSLSLVTKTNWKSDFWGLV